MRRHKKLAAETRKKIENLANESIDYEQVRGSRQELTTIFEEAIQINNKCAELHPERAQDFEAWANEFTSHHSAVIEEIDHVLSSKPAPSEE